MQARRGELVDVLAGCDGVVAELDGRAVGLITWLVATGGTSSGAAGATSAEIRAVAVDPDARGIGIGRALFGAAHLALGAAGVAAAWLVTTNDNAPAIRLYESLGYRVAEVRRGAVDEVQRTIKPTIPVLGHGGVEMHDEIELRRALPGR